MVKIVKKIASENMAQNVLVVSHVAAILNLINYFDGNGIKDLWGYKIKLASITELYFDNDRFIKFSRIVYK